MSDKVNNIVAEIHGELEDIVEAIKRGAAIAFEWVRSEAMKLVVLATQTNFGTKVLNLVSLFHGDTSMSGTQKMDAIVRALVNAGTDLLAAGGWQGLFASVKHFLQAAVQLVFNDFAAGLQKIQHA